MSENLVHALSGAGGGIISLLLTYPLNTVSSRMQVQRSNKTNQSTYDVITKIINTEGIWGLYAGLDSALLGITVTNGVYYYFYEWTKAGFEQASRRKDVSTFETVISGAVAGAATVLITNPIWVVNTRMSTRKQSVEELDDGEVKKEKSLNSYQALLNIVKEDGVLALWQGVVPALILVSNPIIQYTVFEQSKIMLEKYRKLGNLDFFLLGAFGKLIATVMTYPYIVIKSRMQLRQSSSDESLRYDSVWDGIRKIIKHEGVQGLFKGIESKLLQSMLNAAILFMAKEQLFQYTLRLLHSLQSGSSRQQGQKRYGNNNQYQQPQNHTHKVNVQHGRY